MTSLKLYEVMEDIGVTEEVIRLRRHVCLIKETIASIMEKRCTTLRCFGSQSEGSTTIGMKSDVDVLYHSDKMIACLQPYRDLFSKVCSVHIVIKTEMSLAQCCSLQLVKLDDDGTFVPITVKNMDDKFKAVINDKYVLDQHGRVLLSHSFLLQSLSPENWTHEIEQHGPAITLLGKVDTVVAIYCSSMPDECRVVLSKQNPPGHWPKLETNMKAHKCGVYLVPSGNLSHTFTYNPVRSAVIMHVRYARDYSNSQWRLSNNMIERLLMFDLNIVQMKTYILTKMIRKEFLKPIVGDRLSTFHMKTALFVTVETFPEDIWSKDNLVQCVLNCLITLRRFLKRRFCPHYTVSSVNLFYDKLQLWEYQNIMDTLSVIINSQLKCIESLRMDDIGDRLLTSQGASSSIPKCRLSTRNDNVTQIIMHLVVDFMTIPSLLSFEQEFFAKCIESYLQSCVANFETASQHGSEYCEELGFCLKYFYNHLASVIASKSIAMQSPINEDIVKMYELSLGPAHIPNYLKYASMLVCTQQYGSAEALLQHVECIISSGMIDVGYPTYDSTYKRDKRIQVDAIHITGVSSSTDILMRHVSKTLLDVVFITSELSCVPSLLAVEIYRTGTGEECRVREQTQAIALKMKCFIVDAKSFLHYLQYLSSKDIYAKQLAFTKLKARTKVKDVCYPVRIDTSLNMMGHIFELEKRFPEAWTMYKDSVKKRRVNNAAYWHLFRLLGHCMYGK